MQNGGFDEKTYVAYNDAIFEYFFNQDRSGQLTTLAFDDYAAAQIATDLALTGDDLATRLCRMVGALINPAKQDPYVFWTRRPVRMSTGLLSCAVLVMSRLGSDSAGVVDHRGFHRLYNKMILGIDAEQNVPAIHLQDNLWRRFAEYLNVEEGGVLGVLTFPPLLRYKHLQYPASQCLVRMTDRRRLHNLFHEFFDPAQDLDRDVSFRLLKQRASELTLMLQRAVAHLEQDEELSKQLWQIIAAEYEVWRASPEQVARRASNRRHGTHHDSRHSISHPAERVSGAANTPLDDIAALVPVVASLPRIRSAVPRPQLTTIESRLALVEPYRSPGVLYVEVRPKAEIAAEAVATISADGWLRLREPVTSADFASGFERIVSSCRIREYGRIMCVFGLSEQGWIETERLAVGQALRIVYQPPAQEEINQLLSLAAEWHSIQMADEGLSCVSLTLDQRTQREDLPSAVADVLGESVATVKLGSGLRLRNGHYLADGPPEVTFSHPAAERLDVFVDGEAEGSAEREVPFRIRRSLSAGRHTVTVADRSRTFVVADDEDIEHEAATAADEADTGLGTIVARYPPRLETRLDAEAMKTIELGRLNAVVVVGADLLLPYARAPLGL